MVPDKNITSPCSKLTVTLYCLSTPERTLLRCQLIIYFPPFIKLTPPHLPCRLIIHTPFSLHPCLLHHFIQYPLPSSLSILSWQVISNASFPSLPPLLSCQVIFHSSLSLPYSPDFPPSSFSPSTLLLGKFIPYSPFPLLTLHYY